jgi:hypothetical protein
MDAQRTEAWFAKRVRQAHRLRFADVMNVLKDGKPGAQGSLVTRCSRSSA